MVELKLGWSGEYMSHVGNYICHLPGFGTVAILSNYKHVLVQYDVTPTKLRPATKLVKRIPCDGLLHALALIYNEMIERGVYDYLPEEYKSPAGVARRSED